MPRRDTPLIRPGEKRNATRWFYGVGAVFAVALLLLWLVISLVPSEDPPAGTAAPGVEVQPID